MNKRIVALAAWIALAAPALAQQQPPTLAANGEGEVMVVPDIAIVTIGVTSRAATARDALAANSTDVNAVLETIRAEGVAEVDIGTSGFSVSPVYEERPAGGRTDQPPRIVGYQVSNQVRVTIRDIATSGEILDKVVTAGANQVNGISFDIADRKTHEEEAIKLAIADARRQGELMAEAAGVRLVRILSVNANAGGGPVFARADFAIAAAVPVAPGQQSVSANASISWEVAPE